MLVATGSQLTTALALIELDGIARRITLCPTDLSAEHFPAVAAGADADAIVYDGGSVERAALNLPARVICSGTITPSDLAPVDRIQTEWLLLTSGTTGVPKIVMHSLAGLTGRDQARSSCGTARRMGHLL